MRFWCKLLENRYLLHVEDERRPLDDKKWKAKTQMRGFVTQLSKNSTRELASDGFCSWAAELRIIDICAHGPSRGRSILTAWAHVDLSLRPDDTPKDRCKQLGTIWSASRSVYDAKTSKNKQNDRRSTIFEVAKKFDFWRSKLLKLNIHIPLEVKFVFFTSDPGAWSLISAN